MCNDINCNNTDKKLICILAH